MERILIENGANDPSLGISIALGWLNDHRGGYAVMDNKKALMDSLGLRTDSQFREYQKTMSEHGIHFAWRRGRGQNALPYSGAFAALFPTKWLIDEMEGGNLNALMVVGWAESDFRQWADENDPETMFITKKKYKVH